MKNKILSFLSIYLLLFTSCATTTNQQNDEVSLIYKKSLSNFEKDGYNYIFFRLYYPDYNNPLCIENTLKNLIGFIDIHPEKYSHAAIGFDLNDNFIGLTSAGPKDLKIEQCTNINSNPFMEKCNPKKSIQTIYALKVTSQEYKRAKEIVDYFYYEKADYSIGLNFAIGLFEIKRKFFSSQESKQLKNLGTNKNGSQYNEYSDQFVCSSFISYVLINSVDSIRQFFEENNLDYNLIIPSDIISFPGVQKLFTSSWQSYTNAALAYTNSENNIFNTNK